VRPLLCPCEFESVVEVGVEVADAEDYFHGDGVAHIGMIFCLPSRVRVLFSMGRLGRE
jgi:hypothetical protein